MSKIRSKDRDAVIQSLRAGVVPRVGQHLIQVGRVGELDALIKDVDRLADSGSAFRVVIGEYGAGKTFFLNLVRAIAMERKLVTMHADLNPDRRLHATGGQPRTCQRGQNPMGGHCKASLKNSSPKLNPKPRQQVLTVKLSFANT